MSAHSIGIGYEMWEFRPWQAGQGVYFYTNGTENVEQYGFKKIFIKYGLVFLLFF